MQRPQALLYKVLKVLFRFVFAKLVGWRIVGLENIPANGSIIVVMNHVHRLDSVVVLSALPRMAIPLIASDVIRGHPLLSSIITSIGRNIGGIVIDRHGGSNIAALRSACRKVQAGVSILIAPEGTRSPNSELRTFHDGASYLARVTGARIVPVVTFGYKESLRPQLFGRKPINVVVGSSFQISKSPSRGRGAREMATKEIRIKLGTLVDEYVQNTYQ